MINEFFEELRSDLLESFRLRNESPTSREEVPVLISSLRYWESQPLCCLVRHLEKQHEAV
jgi:hypothetical protein